MWVYHPLASARLARICQLAAPASQGSRGWSCSPGRSTARSGCGSWSRWASTGSAPTTRGCWRVSRVDLAKRGQSRTRLVGDVALADQEDADRDQARRPGGEDEAAADLAEGAVAFEMAVERAEGLGREVFADRPRQQFGQGGEDEEEGDRGDDRADLVADDRADAEAEGAEQRKGDDDSGIDRGEVAGAGQVPAPHADQREREAAVDGDEGETGEEADQQRGGAA